MVDDEYIQENQEHINQVGDDPKESVPSVIKDQQDSFVTQQDDGDLQTLGDESEDSHTTYLHACTVFSEAQRQYELRNKNVVVTPPSKGV